MTGLYRVFDAAYPPAAAPPGVQGVLGYIGGGRATHQWKLTEWDRFARLVQFPCYVPDFSTETAQTAADSAVMLMKESGWAPFQTPRRVVVVDLETLNERNWYAAFASRVETQGFTAAAYGSLSTVLENAAGDVWAAAWDGSATLMSGQTIHGHQYTASNAIDYSVVDDWLFARGGQGPRHA